MERLLPRHLQIIYLINRALLDIESSGEAAKIFDAWFGPNSREPMPRKFIIKAD